MQRICDDVPAFTDGSTNLMFGITRKIFGVVAFSGKPIPFQMQPLDPSNLLPIACQRIINAFGTDQQGGFCR